MTSRRKGQARKRAKRRATPRSTQHHHEDLGGETRGPDYRETQRRDRRTDG
ncbi:MAG: hypothetical protein WAV00_16415 [Nocardioides sp.]